MKVPRNVLLLFCLFFLLPMVIFLGYTITSVCSVTFTILIVLVVLGRNDIKQVLSKRINRYSLIALSVIVLFFLIFSIFFLKRTELIFFDEQIYQSIAINILKHGNALACVYGTAQLKTCYTNSIGFDPNGWPFLIALGFGLFGTGVSTSYNLELFISVVSIILVFLLSSVLTHRKEIPIIATTIFALIPELFIWSKTQANPNIPFMMFATLTLFFFVLFIKKRTKFTLMLSTFSLVFTIYLRVEALLLIPIFIIIFLTFGENGIKETFRKQMGFIQHKIPLAKIAPLLTAFLLLIAPEILVIIATGPELLDNALPFLGSSTKLFSLSYLPENIFQNTSFFAGSVAVYPIIFLPEIIIFAIIGIISLILYGKKRYKENQGILLLLLLMFLSYFIFYSTYFSGSALSGGGVRFMLITYPTLSILAAFGVSGFGDWVASFASRKRKQSNKHHTTLRLFTYITLITIFFIVPFLCTIPFLRNPNYNYADFPIIPNTTPQNDPYSMMYANKSLNFINNNYRLVPANCLVFSPSPYLWYGLNRSAANSYLYNASIPSIKNYRCFVFDYSYLCTISPNNATTCNTFLTKYKLKILATESGGINSNFSIYQILNYTPT